MSNIKEELKKITINIFLFTIICVSIDIFFTTCSHKEYIYLASTKLAFVSAFFVALCFFVFFAITKKTWKTFVIISILIFVISIINLLKMIYTEATLSFYDIYFLKNSGQLIDIVDTSLPNAIKMYIPRILIYFIFLTACCIISYFNNLTITKMKTRISLFLIPFVILLILFIPNKFINDIIVKTIYNAENRVDYNRNTSDQEETVYNGFIARMYQALLESRVFKPEGYNENIIEKINNIAQKEEDNSLGKPNIIVLFAESFWNVDLLEDVTFDKKITSNFEKLKKEGIFFDMITPSHGGASSNVEFQFLTGASLSYFPKGYLATMRLFNSSKSSVPSITKELKNNGYRTKMVNFTPDSSFNIKAFYKNIEIDEMEFNTKIDKKNIKGDYVSDEYVVDKIIEEFNNKPKGERLFYMTLTMQAHMPYLIEKYENYDIEVKESPYSQSVNETLLSYAQGIYDTDLQLKRLYDYIQTLEEPTMLVFYGDHLPYLKTKDEEDLFNILTYFNTDNELLNTYRKYNTQSLILANYKLEKEDREYISTDLLGTYIVNKMDIELSQYYKWLYQYIDIIPSVNWYVAIDKKGKLYSIDSLKERFKDEYDLRENVQYYYFVRN